MAWMVYVTTRLSMDDPEWGEFSKMVGAEYPSPTYHETQEEAEGVAKEIYEKRNAKTPYLKWRVSWSCPTTGVCNWIPRPSI